VGFYEAISYHLPFLKGVNAVVLDEFHEHHLESDLALALLNGSSKVALSSASSSCRQHSLDDIEAGGSARCGIGCAGNLTG